MNQDPSINAQADLNGDGKVDVDDLNMVINIVLQG
ncbi:MAG: hypothetical protein IKR25_09570 [Muribaculaceae bacterium]|nr:hypothetical protein [Muribaculaceae bacterium]